jgi:hypothetical protein
MEQDANLKEIEGKACRSMRQDGLDNVMEGVSLALMALFLYDRRQSWAFVLGVGMQLWHWLKEAFRRRFIYQRQGHAKFQTVKSKAGIMRAIAGVVLIALLGILLIIVPEAVAQKNGAFPWGWILPVYAGFVLAGLAFAAAHRYGYVLDYIFSALFLESIFVGLVLLFLGIPAGKATAYQLWGLATILIFVGLVKFMRFLHSYPRTSAGRSDGRREQEQ